jgi:formate dehydrogenase iron-sulfur subunit
METYGQNRMAEGKPPMCASMCSTKALLAGDSDEVSAIFISRVASKDRGTVAQPLIWDQIYGK